MIRDFLKSDHNAIVVFVIVVLLTLVGIFGYRWYKARPEPELPPPPTLSESQRAEFYWFFDPKYDRRHTDDNPKASPLDVVTNDRNGRTEND